MKWQPPVNLLLLSGLLLTQTAWAGRTNVVESTFATGPEGWQGVDLPDAARLVDPAPGTTLTWTNVPPPTGASVSISDTTSGTIFFSAPPQVVQALGLFHGSFLEFELETTHQTWKESDFVVIRGPLNGEIRAAVGQLPTRPGSTWTQYDIRLVAANFRWNEKNGAVIAPQDFRPFLRTATALWLPAEFGLGPVETTSLRHVRVVAEEFLAIQCVPAVTLDGFAGQQFRIEFQTVLGSPQWTPLTNVTLTSGNYFFIDTGSVEGLHRFYRAIELP